MFRSHRDWNLPADPVPCSVSIAWRVVVVIRSVTFILLATDVDDSQEFLFELVLFAREGLEHEGIAAGVVKGVFDVVGRQTADDRLVEAVGAYLADGFGSQQLFLNTRHVLVHEYQIEAIVFLSAGARRFVQEFLGPLGPRGDDLDSGFSARGFLAVPSRIDLFQCSGKELAHDHVVVDEQDRKILRKLCERKLLVSFATSCFFLVRVRVDRILRGVLEGIFSIAGLQCGREWHHFCGSLLLLLHCFEAGKRHVHIGRKGILPAIGGTLAERNGGLCE
mmetsp:Transcript_21173/g.44516  ORF Transcript_21173/g.44516 Transcript_21173/m.44516 type:complete len:278 (+) Transcript_21173:502-1335(+)